ncbi:hypothetical protein CVS47_00857 [Microbacterium lemovicicum]|uniref:Glycosyltransferase RgtA/B/C/D-like domain-containing protein n=1 Tax=Microbacterium lemovicicum TaxID=1072463 RepID=A0A3S9W883_9MICO|nr:hypothetical protein [Microbacterium lemovicicum]AZS36257.1 hypothetical protein CVS47_00857 [Microbacterium lemovicicum]
MTAQEQERAATTVPPPGASDRTSLVARVWNGSMRLLRSAPTTTINRDPLPAGVISRVLLLWGVGRAINLLILFGWYQISKAGKWGFGPEGELVTTFLNFLSDWDGARYGRISQVGYPTWLPLAPSGVVQPNDWAFLPVFPWLERVISDALGVPWQAAGVGISIIASAGATVMLYLLLHRVTTPKSAWWGVVLFTLSPLSFVFVLAYAESLILMLLFACLLLAVNRRYAWIAPVGVLAAYVRPGGLAIALTLGVVFLVRWARRAEDPFPAAQRWGMIVSAGLISVAGLSWSYIAQAVTGTRDAYVRTEIAWWIPFVGDGHFVPLTPWFRFWGSYLGILGVLMVLTIAGGFIVWMRSKPIRALGVEVWSFVAGYGLYLFAVFLPQQSLFRLLMPMAPLLADSRLSSTATRRRLGVVVCIVLQVVAVLLLWTIGWP